MTDTAIGNPPNQADGQTITAHHACPTAGSLTDFSNLARILGGVSLGMGALKLIAPQTVAGFAGARRSDKMVRLHGLRDLALGLGIFTGSSPQPWLWLRLAGDVVDAFALVTGSRKKKEGVHFGPLALLVGVGALDALCARNAAPLEARNARKGRAEANVLIARSPEECYRFWRDLHNIPRFVSDRLQVHQISPKQAHWTLQLPGDLANLEWNVESLEEVPSQRISWRHLPGSPIDAEGTVTFEAAPGGRGTYIHVQIDFGFPAQSVAEPLSRLLGKHPEQLLYKSLRRMKQLMEVGEVMTTEGQPAGRRNSTTWLDAIAR